MSSFGIGMRWFTLALAFALALPGQDADMAERLFSSGERAYASKAYPEAMETWNQVIQTAPASPFAAQALMRLAQYQLEVEKKPEAALPMLDKVRTEHLKTPWAAQAMLLRSKILTERSHSPRELKEAQADLDRLVDLYPGSPEVQEARFLMGSAFFLQGQWGRALQEFTEARRLDPATSLALKAQLQAAETLDLMGDTAGCLRTLQALRTHAPKAPEALEAAWRLNVRAKQRILKPALHSEGPWPPGKVKWLKTPTLMAMGPGGELYLYQDDLDRAFLLQDGQLTPAGPVAKGAKAMIATPSGQLWLVTRLGLVKEGTATAALTPLPYTPSGAFRDGWGRIWAGDPKANALQNLSPDGPRTLPLNASALAPLPNGSAVLASDTERTLVYLDTEELPKVTVPYGKDLPAPFKTVLALASDPLGHVAALVDGDFEGVVIWGPDGALLRFATFKTLGISGKFRALALDRQGGVILADRSNDTLIRLD